jgi:hypothetical protein
MYLFPALCFEGIFTRRDGLSQEPTPPLGRRREERIPSARGLDVTTRRAKSSKSLTWILMNPVTIERRSVMTKLRGILAVLPGLLVLLAGPATAGDKIQQTFNVPAQFVANVQTTNCTAAPGPQVTLAGNLTVSPLNVGVIFSKMQNSSPQGSVEVAKMVVPANAPPTIAPEQSVVGVMSNNPYLWLQLTDDKGRALTSEIFLGRCDQGSFSPTINLMLPSSVTGSVAANSCTDTAGPIVTLSGQVETGAIHGKVIFRNSSDIGVGALKPSEASIDVLLLASGPAFQLPQDPAQAGTGGNPIVSTQFRQSDGSAIGAEQNLGRCTSIVNGK